jgi:hypothetical protein
MWRRAGGGVKHLTPAPTPVTHALLLAFLTRGDMDLFRILNGVI